MTLLLLLVLRTVPFQCELEDAGCWRAAALGQLERAELAEQRASLEHAAQLVIQKMLEEETSRSERWKKTAIEVAPPKPAFYESPLFWGAVGVLSGAVLTIGIGYALSPAR